MVRSIHKGIERELLARIMQLGYSEVSIRELRGSVAPFTYLSLTHEVSIRELRVIRARRENRSLLEVSIRELRVIQVSIFLMLSSRKYP